MKYSPENRFEYGTIGTHKFTISAFHDPVGNTWVGNHPRVFASEYLRSPARLLNVLCKFNLRPVSTGTTVSQMKKTCYMHKKPHPNIKLYDFPGDDKLCVCKTIYSYLERCNVWGIGESQFLVSHIKPHRPVSP